MSLRDGKIAPRAAAVARYRRRPAALDAKIISRPSRDRNRSVIGVKKISARRARRDDAEIGSEAGGSEQALSSPGPLYNVARR
jgi:hypothetical protein